MNSPVNAKEVEKTGTKNPDGTEAVKQEVKRSGIVSKKMLVISSMACGGVAFLLWAMLGFPKKFKSPKNMKESRCPWSAIVCPKCWYQIYDRCFHESEKEATWKNGEENCMAHHGSLLIFSSQNEVDFLSYYLGNSSYWIGLKKHDVSDRWMWANGDALSERYTIEGSGECAFIFKNGISSANCDDAKHYICSLKGLCP